MKLSLESLEQMTDDSSTIFMSYMQYISRMRLEWQISINPSLIYVWFTDQSLEDQDWFESEWPVLIVFHNYSK